MANLYMRFPKGKVKAVTLSYDDGVDTDIRLINIMQQCGIAYARTVQSTHEFGIPENWLTLHPTCHHTEPELFRLCESFLQNDRGMKPLLFYLWGHSYEFERDDNWPVFEKFAQQMGNRQDIWYATNMEVYEYVTAYRQLVFAADASQVMNPTARTLYLQCGQKIHEIEPGKTVRLW